MKTWKLFLSGLFLLGLPSVAPAQFNFETNADNTITITGYTGADSVVVIPDTTNGYPVTGIGNSAFVGCTGLTNITIPPSITSIGVWGFAGCYNLAGITIPDSVTNIDDGAFNSCRSLTNVVIPASVSNIGDYVFFYCTNLTAIMVNATNAFYCSADGVLFNKDKTILLQFPFGKGGSYAIPDSVTSLADEAFGMNDQNQYPYPYAACASLTNLIIPGSITSLDDHAFSHCTGLITVTLGHGVGSIGTNAFSWCLNLTGITIPSSVTNIGELAFYYSGLTQVTVPGSVTNWGLGAFAVCSNLTNVILQDGVTSIGVAGFNLCTNLTNIAIPDSVTNIGERAFWLCTGLTNVTIPSQVANIGDFAFARCASLININVSADNIWYKSVDGVLFNGDQTTLIQLPGGRSGSYRIPSGVICIGENAFDCHSPDGLSGFLIRYPDSYANLTNIIIPATVTAIGDDAFAYLYNRSSICFEGDAPPDRYDWGYFFPFYYLPGTSGWSWSDLPWLPAMQASDANFGTKTHPFGFNIEWASGKTVVVEASTNLIDWQPVQTNTLTSGSAYFSDPEWNNYPGRFYRLCSPQ